MTDNQATNHPSAVPTSILTLLLLLIPLYFQLAWIIAFNSAASHKARLEIFYNYLPSFLADAHLVAIIGLICSVLVIIISSRLLIVINIGWRIFHLVALVISTLLFMLNLFQLL